MDRLVSDNKINFLCRFIIAEVKHVESESVVIIGKGTGGYLATMMMAKDTVHLLEEETREIFKCGIIISPTIDWFKYGSSISFFSKSETSHLKI